MGGCLGRQSIAVPHSILFLFNNPPEPFTAYMYSNPLFSLSFLPFVQFNLFLFFLSDRGSHPGRPRTFIYMFVSTITWLKFFPWVRERQKDIYKKCVGFLMRNFNSLNVYNG
jgi:hypothetical protein